MSPPENTGTAAPLDDAIKPAGTTQPPPQRKPRPTSAKKPKRSATEARPSPTVRLYDKFEDDNLRLEKEARSLRQTIEQRDERILELARENERFKTENEFHRRELRGNTFSLILSTSMVGISGAILDYASSHSAKVIAFCVALSGCFWGLWQGVVTIIKDERESLHARRTAGALMAVIIILMALRWRDIAELFSL